MGALEVTHARYFATVEKILLDKARRNLAFASGERESSQTNTRKAYEEGRRKRTI
jgi:hypothetical protein